jgi:hypothetical protein
MHLEQNYSLEMNKNETRVRNGQKIQKNATKNKSLTYLEPGTTISN